MRSVARASRSSTTAVVVSPTEASKTPRALRNVGLRRTNNRRRPSRPPSALTTKTSCSSASRSEAAVTISKNSSAFASAASGEWDGMLVTFDADSSPAGGGEGAATIAARELPREFVPETFREWGVSVRDWQTQCSMRASASESSSIEYRVRRLLPSVGCEADATAFVDEAVVATSSPASSSSDSGSRPQLLLAALPDGSYALVPSKIPNGSEGEAVARVEACLPLEGTSPGGSRRRVRLVLFSRPPSSAASSSPPPCSSLTAVEVHSETHDSDFCGGATLSGCGGSVPQFSSKEKTDASDLDSFSWAPVVEDEGSPSSEAFIFSRETCSLTPSSKRPPARKTRGGPEGRLLLPLRSWASLRRSAAPEGGVVFEAGVLLNSSEGESDESPRRRKVMTAAYSGKGDLTGVLLATEEVVLSDRDS